MLTILLFACGKSANKDNRIEINGLRIPYIIGRFPSTEEILETERMQRAESVLCYIGPLTDTIRFNNYEIRRHEKRRSIQDLKLKIVASTIQFIATASRESGNWRYVQAIPVFVFNPTNDTIPLEHRNRKIKMIQEAKNENGDWRPLEFCVEASGAERYETTALLPNEMALIHVLRYDGDFVTDVRLKFKIGRQVVYSNTYKAMIYKSQFEIPNHINKIKDNNSEFFDQIFLKAG